VNDDARLERRGFPSRKRSGSSSVEIAGMAIERARRGRSSKTRGFARENAREDAARGLPRSVRDFRLRARGSRATSNDRIARLHRVLSRKDT
jgi:hypothetical protein